MKKKHIEKIPYMGLKKTNRKKRVRYIGVTAVKNVAHERHLFLEVYKNKKECMAEPVVRIVCTKKDFGTYFPDKREWTRQTLGSSYSKFIWESWVYRKWNAEEQNILESAADLERIRKFFPGIKVWNGETRWWEYIKKKQDSIVCSERERRALRKHEKRRQALRERQENTPELPEEWLLQKADKIFFTKSITSFTRKRGAGSGQPVHNAEALRRQDGEWGCLMKASSRGP